MHVDRFGGEILKTCKQSTTKDFLWISPELVPFFRQAEVINHVFPDHGAVIAHFDFAGHDANVFLWRQPKPIPWDECQGKIPSAAFHLPELVSPEEACRQVSQEFENRIHQNLVHQSKPGLLAHERGRSCTLEPQKMQSHSAPLKASRPGDVQPEFHGQNLQQQRWFTQLRRLESLARLYRAQPWNHNQVVDWHGIESSPQGLGLCRIQPVVASTPKQARWSPRSAAA